MVVYNCFCSPNIKEFCVELWNISHILHTVIYELFATVTWSYHRYTLYERGCTSSRVPTGQMSETHSVQKQNSNMGDFLLSYLFLLIQLTSFSETELLWQINNLKSHMHKMWVTWGRKMTAEMRKRKKVGLCRVYCALEKPSEGNNAH